MEWKWEMLSLLLVFEYTSIYFMRMYFIYMKTNHVYIQYFHASVFLPGVSVQTPRTTDWCPGNAFIISWVYHCYQVTSTSVLALQSLSPGMHAQYAFAFSSLTSHVKFVVCGFGAARPVLVQGRVCDWVWMDAAFLGWFMSLWRVFNSTCKSDF